MPKKSVYANAQIRHLQAQLREKEIELEALYHLIETRMMEVIVVLEENGFADKIDLQELKEEFTNRCRSSKH